MKPGDDVTTGSCPHAAADPSPLDADTLRRVAEEVRGAFPRPLRGPELVLIDVDPRRLHAFWTLDVGMVAAARHALGADGGPPPMVLRVYESPADALGTAFDVEVVGLQGQCYVDIWGDVRRYCGELGLLRPDGGFHPLTRSPPVELPRLEAAAEGAPRDEAATATLFAPAPAAVAAAPLAALPGEPVRHPFPLPPTEPGEYVPEVRSGDAAADVPPPPPAPIPQLPEPVRHPFPLPPSEPDAYVPEALIGGFLPADGPAPAAPPQDAGPPAAEAPPAADSHPGGVPAPAGEPIDVLMLENVLTLSSWALGRETVELEINAELHIFGRVRPGTQLQLFGRKVHVRPDGSFSITRPLPNGALLLSSLLIDSGDDPTTD